MSSFNDIQDGPVYVPKKSSWGCMIYGCLIVVVLMIVVSFCGVGGALWWANSQVKKYTSDQAIQLPTVELSPEELAEIESRVETFKEAIDRGDVPGELILTADEINALINKNEDLKGKVFVAIGDGQVTGKVSFPTDFLPLNKGRFFNAEVTFNVSLEFGDLVVTVASASVNGEEVPQQVIDGMAKENLAKEVNQKPNVRETLSHFESLVIKDDKIILTPAKKSSPPPLEPIDEIVEPVLPINTN